MVAWAKIKKEYIEGATPSELAKKYNTTSGAIRSKAHRENWQKSREDLSNAVQQTVTNRITSLTSKALDTCEGVMDDPNASYKDKLTAAGLAISISGLKKDKQEITTNQPAVNLTINKADIKEIANDINDLADE